LKQLTISDLNSSLGPETISALRNKQSCLAAILTMLSCV